MYFLVLLRLFFYVLLPLLSTAVQAISWQSLFIDRRSRSALEKIIEKDKYYFFATCFTMRNLLTLFEQLRSRLVDQTTLIINSCGISFDELMCCLLIVDSSHIESFFYNRIPGLVILYLSNSLSIPTPDIRSRREPVKCQPFRCCPFDRKLSSSMGCVGIVFH